MKRLLTAVLVLTLWVPCVAQASVLDGPYTTTTPIPLTKTDWSGTMSLPKFDPALGTLISVELWVNASMQTVITVTNTGGSASSGTAKTELQFSVQDAGDHLNVPEIDMFSSNYSFTNLPAGQHVTSGTITKSGTDDQFYYDAGTLAAFTGLGTIVLDASTYTLAWVAYNGGNTDASQVTNASATAKVTYEYNPVPEPATMGLLALSGLALIRRRQK